MRNDRDTPAEPVADPARDEPPWSPALLDLIAERGQVWLAHDKDDAELLLRPDAGDVPALWLPKHHLKWLTPELVKPLNTIRVIQRPDDVLGDGFYAGYGVKVQAQLEAVGGRGTLERIVLEDPFGALADVWAHVEEDRERFQLELVRYVAGAVSEDITPTRRAKASRPQVSHNGHGTSAEAPRWRPHIVHAHTVEAQAIQWLWAPYLPRGMLVMLDGDPGLGKSMMLLQVATNLSKGQPFLDQRGQPTLFADVDGPQTTLILSAEDSLAHVMIPRLQRAGADLTRIKFLQGWLGPEDEEHVFTLAYLDVLVQAIEEVKPVLVILDPLVAYLGDIDMHRSNETRPLMAKLGKLAERYACTVLGVRHPSKMDLGGRLMYRGQGNLDLIGAARSGLWVQPHPTHPETETIMLQSKTNVGALGRTVVFSRDKGEFRWKGMSRLTEAMVTGKGPDPYAVLEAFFLFEEAMTPGVPYRSEDMEKLAVAEGSSSRTVDRAKRLLNIRSTKQGDGWYWFLPSL